MNFVLVHGAWHGGWCWQQVAAHLRAAGHRVLTPTLTGLGERAALLRGDTGLETFITEVSTLIDSEALQEVVLVGHSFAGLIISGVADRLPHRLRALVYLDALVAQHGQSALSLMPPAVRRERARTIDAEGWRMAIPDPSAFGVFDPAQRALLERRLTPHPLKAYTDPLQLAHPVGNGVPKTYIAVTDPPYAPLAAVRQALRDDTAWSYREMSAGHDAMITSPEALAMLLDEIARGSAR